MYLYVLSSILSDMGNIGERLNGYVLADTPTGCNVVTLHCCSLWNVSVYIVAVCVKRYVLHCRSLCGTLRFTLSQFCVKRYMIAVRVKRDIVAVCVAREEGEAGDRMEDY